MPPKLFSQIGKKNIDNIIIIKIKQLLAIIIFNF